MAAVKLQLADEEASKTGFETTAPHTRTTFIMIALDIQDSLLVIITITLLCR